MDEKIEVEVLIKYQEINLDNCSKELQFLLKLLNERNDVSNLLEEFHAIINWQEFIKLVNFHKVYPAIYLKFSREDSTFLPMKVKEQIHQLYVNNTFKMLTLSKEMDDINKALYERNIRVMMLKGPALSYQLYGDLSSRTSNDLDILIPFHELELTRSILQSKGYQLEYEPPRKLKDWQKRNHHLEFLHKEKNYKVEVHWRLHPGPSKEPSFEALWNNRKTVYITDKPIYTLDEETLFYYLITHGARHGWFRIRWLTDIVQMINNNPELGQNPLKASEYQAFHLFQQTVHLLEGTKLLSVSYSIKINKRSKMLAQKAFTFIKERIDFYHPPSKEWDKEGLKYLFEIKPFAQKLDFFIRKFAGNSWDAEVLPLPPALHFLYIPLRPFLWLWRAIIKQKVSFRRL